MIAYKNKMDKVKNKAYKNDATYKHTLDRVHGGSRHQKQKCHDLY